LRRCEPQHDISKPSKIDDSRMKIGCRGFFDFDFGHVIVVHLHHASHRREEDRKNDGGNDLLLRETNPRKIVTEQG